MAITAADLRVKFSSDGADKVASDANKAGSAISSFGKNVAQFAGGFLLGNAVQAVARGVGDLAGQALDFGKEMANVNSIAQLSGDQIGVVSDQVLALATDPRIAQAPAVLAAGLYDVYSSGFQGADGMKILEASAVAATAGITDTATSARAITAVLNAYGFAAGDASHVSDVLFQTVNDGVISFETLANNMGNTLPAANALGVTFEELAAAYAQMTLKGVSGAQAETQIASLMKSAANPTQALTDAVQAQGYATAAAAIEAEGFAGFLGMVTEAADGNDAALYDMLGTQEAVNAAHILGADNAAEYTKEIEKMQDSSMGAGATNKALAKQMESASFQIQKAKQSLQVLATILVGAVSPAIAKVASALTSFVTKGLIPFVDVIGEAFKGGFAFNELVKQFPQPLQRTVHAIGVVVEALGDMWRDGFSANEMRQAIGGLRAIGEELQQGLRFVANVVIDTAVDLAGWLWDHRGDIWGGIKDLVGWGAGEFREAVTVAIGGAIELAGDLKDAAGDLYGWIKRKLFGGAIAGDQTGGPEGAGLGVIDLGDVTLRLAQLLVESAQTVGGAVVDWVAKEWAAWDREVTLGGWKIHLDKPGIDLTSPSLDEWIQAAVTGAGNVKSEVHEWSLVLNDQPDVQTPGGGKPDSNWLQGIIQRDLDRPVEFRIPILNLTLGDLKMVGGGLLFASDVGQFLTEQLQDVDATLSQWNLDVTGPPTLGILGANLVATVIDDIGAALDAAGMVADLTDWEIDLGIPIVDPIPVADLIQWVRDAMPHVSVDISDFVDLVMGGGDSGTGQVAPINPAVAEASGVDAILRGRRGYGYGQSGTYGNAQPGGSTFTSGGNPLGFIMPPGYGDPMVMGKVSIDTSEAEKNIADIVGKLQDVSSQTYSSTFDIDIGPASQQYTMAYNLGDTWDAALFTSTFDIDIGPAAVQYTAAYNLGNVWDAAIFTSTFDIDIGPAAVAYTTAFGWGYAWAGQTFTARFSVDTSGITAAVGVARNAAAEIAALLPHSPAKKGPLAFMPSFKYIADAARRDLSGLSDVVSGAISPRGLPRSLAAAGGHRNVNITIHAAHDPEATWRVLDRELSQRGL